jgi:hypothetical protein
LPADTGSEVKNGAVGGRREYGQDVLLVGASAAPVFGAKHDVIVPHVPRSIGIGRLGGPSDERVGGVEGQSGRTGDERVGHRIGVGIDRQEIVGVVLAGDDRDLGDGRERRGAVELACQH